MKLLKVSVPNFRNLKNVELTFEPSLKPAVFPIGSDNGGGKSTLLQLIFVLLTCSLDEAKFQYLENFIIASNFAKYFQNNEATESTIASVEFLYNQKNIKVDFDIISDIEMKSSYKDIDEYLKILNLNKDLQKKLTVLETQHTEYYTEWEFIQKSNFIDQMYEDVIEEVEQETSYYKTRKEELKNKIYNLNSQLTSLEKNKQKQGIISCNVMQNNRSLLLISKTNMDDYDVAKKLLEYVSNHIYLATPSTQPYLFMDKESRQDLLKDFDKYQQNITKLRKNLSNIYVHNQLAVTEILHAFKQAVNNDFKTAISQNNLEYGTALKELVEDFHDFLGNDKYIFPSSDMTSIIVRRKISDNEFIELEPEELSHGELKRLGLYAWIKYNNINDSIILIDEIENGLHPDWQYNIVNELASWGDNQYLLATHSFYLCEALTPGHVKIIKPKLSNP